MTPSALQAKIAGLRQAAHGMDEPERTLKLQDIATLETRIQDMALDEIVHKLEQIGPSSQHDMDALIHKACMASHDERARMQCFDQALRLLEAALGLTA